jgi:transcriptional regulator with XRE-family HTH domain
VLRKLRQDRGLKQKDLADRLGYEPSYISALERSEKGPPRQDFVGRLIRGLALDEDEREELATALQASRRQISLPSRASEQEYGLLRELEPQLGYLNPVQIQLIELALRLPQSACLSVRPANPQEQEEPKM